MAVVSNMLTQLKAQRGALLMEAIVVVAIIGIMAVIAVPNMRETWIKNDLESAQETLATTMDRARAQAKSRNVFITVTLLQNVLTIVPGDGSANQIVSLPERVTVTPTDNIVFSPSGELAGAKHGMISPVDSTVPLPPSGERIMFPVVFPPIVRV